MVNNHQVKINLQSIPIILICHCPMVRVIFVSALTCQSEYTHQKVYGHIEACHVTAALSPNLLEIRRAKFDLHHSQNVKEAPKRSSHYQNCFFILQIM